MDIAYLSVDLQFYVVELLGVKMDVIKYYNVIQYMVLFDVALFGFDRESKNTILTVKYE